MVRFGPVRLVRFGFLFLPARESNPLKSIMLVGRLTVDAKAYDDACFFGSPFSDPPSGDGGELSAMIYYNPQLIYIYIYIHTYTPII